MPAHTADLLPSSSSFVVCVGSTFLSLVSFTCCNITVNYTYTYTDMEGDTYLIQIKYVHIYRSRSYRGDSNFNALLTPLTFLVTYFNSGVNPLLYAFLSRNFRKGMKELLLCSWKKGKGKSSSNSSMHHKRKALQVSYPTLSQVWLINNNNLCHAQTHSLPTDTTHIGNEQLWWPSCWKTHLRVFGRRS